MISVIKAVIINYTRQKKVMLFNIFFPVFLIIVLGFTLANNFEASKESTLDRIEVLYIDNGNEYTKGALNSLKNMNMDLEINFTEAISIEEAKQMVRVKNSVFIYLNDEVIEFYSNDKFLTDSSLVYGVLKGITNGLNATIEIYKVNPEGALAITPINEEEILSVESISKGKTQSAMDYYGVAEIGLMIFYYFTLPIYFMKDEKKRNIKDRIVVAGVSSRQYYFASFIGYSVVSFASTCVAYLIARFILGVDYGNNLFILPLAVLPFVTLIISFGILLSLIARDEEKSEVIFNLVIIPTLCFFGGGYIPIGDNTNALLNVATKISPLRWFNSGLLRYIYNDNCSMLIQWIILGTVATLIILAFIYYLVGREEVVSGKCMDSI